MRNRKPRQILFSSLLLCAVIAAIALIPLEYSRAQGKPAVGGERIIICMIQLDHADAEYMADILRPFLSPQGSIVPYAPTNTLIIKDRASVVNMLAEIIKGKPCIPLSKAPDSESDTGILP